MAIIYVLSLCHLQPLSESHDHIVVRSLDIALEKRNFSYFTQSMEVTVSTHSCPLKHLFLFSWYKFSWVSSNPTTLWCQWGKQNTMVWFYLLRNPQASGCKNSLIWAEDTLGVAALDSKRYLLWVSPNVNAYSLQRGSPADWWRSGLLICGSINLNYPG